MILVVCRCGGGGEIGSWFSIDECYCCLKKNKKRLLLLYVMGFILVLCLEIFDEDNMELSKFYWE